MDRENVVCTYSGIMFSLKKYVASWLNLEDFRLSGVSQSQKHKYHVTPFVRAV